MFLQLCFSSSTDVLLLHASFKTPLFLHFVTTFLDGIHNTLGALSVARLCLWSVGRKMGWTYAYPHLWSNSVWLEHVQSTCGRMKRECGNQKAAKINFDLLLIFLITLTCIFTIMLAPLTEDFPVNYTVVQWAPYSSQLSHCWNVLGYEAVSLLYGARPISSSCLPIFITYLESVWRLLAKGTLRKSLNTQLFLSKKKFL